MLLQSVLQMVCLEHTKYYVVIACFLLFVWQKRKQKNFPPGPCGIPILGCLPFLGKTPALKFTVKSQRFAVDIPSIRL